MQKTKKINLQRTDHGQNTEDCKTNLTQSEIGVSAHESQTNATTLKKKKLDFKELVIK